MVAERSVLLGNFNQRQPSDENLLATTIRNIQQDIHWFVWTTTKRECWLCFFLALDTQW